MMQIDLLNEQGQAVSKLDVPETVFGREYNEALVHQLVTAYLANARSGNRAQLTRAEVKHSTKKPWRQKGRGGARAGSTRTNVWVGGAVAFGPSNERNYFQKVNKKQKRLALEFALNEKANAGKIFAVDSIEIASGKTKDAAKVISALNLRDALVVKDLLDDNTLLAFRNLSNCYLIDASEINAYLVATYGAVVIEKAALESIIKEG